MAERFFTQDPLSPGEFILEGAEAHHLATVRRFGEGDLVTLFNGDGSEYPAQIVSLSKRTVTLNVLSVQNANRELAYPLVIASALPKGDRADFLLEKLTELGVTQFVPLITERSVVIPKLSTIEKLRRAVIEASKQCGRNLLMRVDEPTKWPALLTMNELPAERLVLHTRSEPLHRVPRSVALAVGPEGGFSRDEVDMAISAGWKTMSLGSRILRVETAAMAAASIFSAG